MDRLYFSDDDPRSYVSYERMDAVPPPRATAVFLHGFMSDQSGEKAVRFREELSSRNVEYITFDFRGHGSSSGSMRELTGTRLLEDLELIIGRLCRSDLPLALIGSSMGGWVASWYAALHPERVAACVLIAPAFRFDDLLCRDAGSERLARWEAAGSIAFENQYGGAELGYDLVRDFARYRVDDLKRMLRAPTLILHGVRDEAVDYRDSIDFVTSAAHHDIELVLLKDGDHRLTSQKDLLAHRAAMFLSERGLLRPHAGNEPARGGLGLLGLPERDAGGG